MSLFDDSNVGRALSHFFEHNEGQRERDEARRLGIERDDMAKDNAGHQPAERMGGPEAPPAPGASDEYISFAMDLLKQQERAKRIGSTATFRAKLVEQAGRTLVDAAKEIRKEG